MSIRPKRVIKIFMLAAMAIFFILVVFNNTTDYVSNFKFVEHVLLMDTIFSQEQNSWRSVGHPLVHHLFYLVIIFWEVCAAVLCIQASIKLYQSVYSDVEFQKAKDFANWGLGLGFFLWFFAFMTIGGEWFLMWQSKVWNGQDSAFRTLCITGIMLIFLNQRD